MIRKHMVWFGLGLAVAGGALALGPVSGLEPPAGAVADTAPSLAELETQIHDLQTSLQSPFPAGLQIAFDSFGGNQQYAKVTFVPDSVGKTVRLYGAVSNAATANMLVGPGEERVMSLSGNAILSGNLTGTSFVSLGGVEVPTPVKFETGGQDSGSTITLLYWVE